MYLEKDIQNIIASVIDNVKKANRPKGQRRDDVNYYTGYKLACDYANKVRVHAEIGEFPENIFRERAPNMTTKEYNYLRGNFKQITLPVWIDYLSTISLPFQDGNWSIEYKGDAPKYSQSESTLQEYLESDIRQFGSLESFIKDMIPHIRGIDPNGVIAVKPYEIPSLPEDDTTLDTSKLFEPQPVYYRCDQIIGKKLDEYYLILLDDKSPVKYSSTVQNIGLVFEFYDENNIWRITQVGEYIDFKFSYELYFSHNEYEVPVTQLKGIPQIINNEIIWQPSFLYACDNLDLALMNANYLQVSISFACFPYLVMVGDDCDYEYHDNATGQLIRCTEGFIDLPNQSRLTCPKCNGSGMKDRISPMGKLLLKQSDSWNKSGDQSFAGKAMEYISPDTSALQFVKEKIEDDTEKARMILHLQRSNTEVKGSENQTATGKSIDQKDKYAFVKPQSDQMFSLFEFIIDRIGWQRYGEDYQKPVLTYPNTFDYNTEEDYMNRISEAQKAGWPPYMIQTIFYRYLKNLYFNEKKTTDVFTLITQVDRLLVLSQDDINVKLTRGSVEKWESILHDSAITFVETLTHDNPSFFEQEFTIQKDQLITLAKQKADSIKSPMQTSTQNAISGILNP